MIHRRERAEGVDPRLLAWLDVAGTELPFDVVVVEGIRTPAKQIEAFTSGHSKAKDPKDAPHCHGGALDIAPLIDGKIPWNPSDAGYEHFADIGLHAASHGLVWGGAWTHLKDLDHVEVQDWRKLPLVT